MLFDHNGVLRKFEAVEEILREFFDLRLKYYSKRKQYLVGMIQAEASKLSNQVSIFIFLSCCSGNLRNKGKVPGSKKVVGNCFPSLVTQELICHHLHYYLFQNYLC